MPAAARRDLRRAARRSSARTPPARGSHDRRRPSTTLRSSSRISKPRSRSTRKTLGFNEVYREIDRRPRRRSGRPAHGRRRHRTVAPARRNVADRQIPRRRPDEAPPHRLPRYRHRRRTRAAESRRHPPDRRTALAAERTATRSPSSTPAAPAESSSNSANANPRRTSTHAMTRDGRRSYKWRAIARSFNK